MTRIQNFGEQEFEAHQQRVKGGPLPRVAVLDILAPGKPERTKFGNRKAYLDRIEFDSEGERDRYLQLRLLETAGVIRGLVVHPAFPLIVDGERIGTYKADFRYLEQGAEVVEDWKSEATAKLRPFMRNIKHVAAQYGVEIRVVMK